MRATIDGYTQVCSVLDELTSSSVMPPGLRGTIFSAIDNLRDSSAPAEHVDIAERISVTVQQLDWAIQKGDGERQANARQQLSTLSETWLSKSAPSH